MKLKVIAPNTDVVTIDRESNLSFLTHLQGEITCDYSLLLAYFGEPETSQDDKIQVEWTVLTPDGIATIYDWKQSDSYLGIGNGTPVEKITDWNIGGHNKKVVEWITKVIKN